MITITSIPKMTSCISFVQVVLMAIGQTKHAVRAVIAPIAGPPRGTPLAMDADPRNNGCKKDFCLEGGKGAG